MEQVITLNSGICNTKFSGSFTFADNAKFRELIGLLEKEPVKTVDIDVSGVTFIDSAALGMFLLLRDIGQKKNIDVVLRSPQGQIKKMFELSKFNQLFTVQN